MIEFEKLQREYPELVRAATYGGISRDDIEKLTFSGPVLLKIIENLVASNRHLGNQLVALDNRLVALDNRAEKLTEAMRTLKNEKTALQNNWNNDRWKWDSI